MFQVRRKSSAGRLKIQKEGLAERKTNEKTVTSILQTGK